MNQEIHEELLHLTQQIVSKMESQELVMTQEEKDTLESMNDSMSFFLEQGDFGRAVIESREILKKLDQILN
jgi:hypothetical protein